MTVSPREGREGLSPLYTIADSRPLHHEICHTGRKHQKSDQPPDESLYLGVTPLPWLPRLTPRLRRLAPNIRYALPRNLGRSRTETIFTKSRMESTPTIFPFSVTVR